MKAVLVLCMVAIATVQAIHINTMQHALTETATKTDTEAGTYRVDTETGVQYRISVSTPCKGIAGTCIDTNSYSCSTTTVRGKCAGAASIIVRPHSLPAAPHCR
jgi:hypothetical protein